MKFSWKKLLRFMLFFTYLFISIGLLINAIINPNYLNNMLAGIASLAICVALIAFARGWNEASE